MIKAIIFDFDGTLADTVPALTVGVNNTLRLLGHPTHSEREILGFVNRGARELIRGALPEQVRDDAAYVDSALALYNREYGKVFLLTQKTYPGLDVLVADLHRRFRVGVLSNKQHEFLTALVRQVLPSGSWDAVAGVEHGKPTKPDPYLPRKLAAALGVDPAECVMVGDSDVDFATAQNAGMIHVGVSWGYRSADFLRAAGATCVVDSVPALSALIETLARDGTGTV